MKGVRTAVRLLRSAGTLLLRSLGCIRLTAGRCAAAARAGRTPVDLARAAGHTHLLHMLDPGTPLREVGGPAPQRCLCWEATYGLSGCPARIASFNAQGGTLKRDPQGGLHA